MRYENIKPLYIRAINKMADRLGIEIVLHWDKRDEYKGWYIPGDNKITINLLRLKDETDLLRVCIHELAHATIRVYPRNAIAINNFEKEYDHDQEEVLARYVEYTFCKQIFFIKYKVYKHHPLPLGQTVTRRWKEHNRQALSFLLDIYNECKEKDYAK